MKKMIDFHFQKKNGITGLGLFSEPKQLKNKNPPNI